MNLRAREVVVLPLEKGRELSLSSDRDKQTIVAMSSMTLLEPQMQNHIFSNLQQ